MKQRSKFGWAAFILGILLIILGVYTIVDPHIVLSGPLILYGLAAILTGSVDIAFYVKFKNRTGFRPYISLFSGVLSVLSGVLLLFIPTPDGWVFTIMMPLWFIAHCISGLTGLELVRERIGKGVYWAQLVINAIGALLGLALLLDPLVPVIPAGYLIGGYMVVIGAAGLTSALSGAGRRQ